MIGDTRDDIEAALGVPGVIPIGISPPGNVPVLSSPYQPTLSVI